MGEIFKVLGDMNRLRILNILMRYELCVCEIEVVLKMTQSNVSRHLSKLKNVKLISSSKDAQWIHYKLNQGFASDNELLFGYLKQNFENDISLMKDTSRCKIYKDSDYNCQTITNDKNIVLEYIDKQTQPNNVAIA